MTEPCRPNSTETSVVQTLSGSYSLGWCGRAREGQALLPWDSLSVLQWWPPCEASDPSTQPHCIIVGGWAAACPSLTTTLSHTPFYSKAVSPEPLPQDSKALWAVTARFLCAESNLHWKAFNSSSELWLLQGTSRWMLCLLPPWHVNGRFSRLDLGGGEAREREVFVSIDVPRFLSTKGHSNYVLTSSTQESCFHVSLLILAVISHSYVCQSNRWERVSCFNVLFLHSYWAIFHVCWSFVISLPWTVGLYPLPEFLPVVYLFHIAIWREWHVLSVILRFVWCECFLQVCG